MIIGIGGVSRAGKTTLADLMSKLFIANGYVTTIIHQDEYVYEEHLIPMIRDRTDWEHPSSIDFGRFERDISEAEARSDLVIAEGLFAFYDRAISARMERRIFVSISKDLFIQRKMEDLRWGSAPDPLWYIDHIWESYLKYGRPEEEDYFLVQGNEYFNLITVMQYILYSDE